MPIHNREVADIFARIADLLELKGANQFRVRAYRNAARTMGGLSRPVKELVDEEKDLSELAGIGKDLADKIVEIVKTGTHSLLKELEQDLPPTLTNLMGIPSLGPKKVKALYDELHIASVDELVAAAEQGRLRSISGFGEKTEKRILEEIKREHKVETGRYRLVVAEEIGNDLIEHLREAKGVKEIAIAGSYRRRKETIGDLDILATCAKDSSVMERFVKYEDVDRVLSHGETRSTVVLRSGVQVDLRVVPAVSRGAAMVYFTGSKEHNIAIRKIAQKKELKINEYGVFRNEERVAGSTEEDVYAQVQLPFIPPELRENRGEIEAASAGKLPNLIELRDIRGDLQMHTTHSDGHFSAEEMAEGAKKKGYDYIAITDHSKRVSVANGLDAKRLRELIKEIDALNDKLSGIRILKSIEVDILDDGSLDLPDEVLSELDLVVLALHYPRNLSREKQTERIIRGMDNPYGNILAHPTGRLLGKREPYDIDMEKVMAAALERGVFLEINAHPERLDLNDIYCKQAREMGLKLAISTDAHRVSDLDYMRFGVWQARRGWLEPGDVINTRSLTDLKKLLKRG